MKNRISEYVFPERPPSPAIDAHIRWMIRRDMFEVLIIENCCFEFPWTEEEFTRCLRQRNCIGMTVDRADEVVAFMIYELHKNRLHILNFAVHPKHQRSGVGTAMMRKLIDKLSFERRNRITLEVRETNLGMQMFLRRIGFRAEQVLRGVYKDTEEDAYLFVYRVCPGDGEHGGVLCG